MELDQFKSEWNNMETTKKSIDDLQTMLLENKHPVLKGIRKQLVIEITGWIVFLLCYYTMFDGSGKPLLVNALLIVSVLLPLVHNLMGYRFAKYLINGASIKASLANYLAKVKIYAFVSIAARVIFIVGLLSFFTYNLSFNSNRYMAIAIIGLTFTVQMVFLSSIWLKRIKNLQKTFLAFN
ncbi:hypothetical protein KXQ82_11955 [Mucilaginibacter sp. HMF5004]|uniref:hypothetical protein n=1 Tax=Mucilaginibacter rivuli TaxID=2857527 RepID=UPI001C5F0451|nr:hypothetical protein [Mucilaginibacter rivuli]MBW4890439.1 hypothetical protein [Mucilaginibacter rivuli]